MNWMTPRMISTQPMVFRLVKMNRCSPTKMFALSSAPIP